MTSAIISSILTFIDDYGLISSWTRWVRHDPLVTTPHCANDFNFICTFIGYNSAHLWVHRCIWIDTLSVITAGVAGAYYQHFCALWLAWITTRVFTPLSIAGESERVGPHPKTLDPPPGTTTQHRCSSDGSQHAADSATAFLCFTPCQRWGPRRLR